MEPGMIHALSRKLHPSFTVPMKMIEEAKNWKVGEEYAVTMKVCQTGVEQMPSGEIEVTFDIKEMGGKKEGGGLDLSDVMPKGNGIGNSVEGTSEGYITA